MKLRFEMRKKLNKEEVLKDYLDEEFNEEKSKYEVLTLEEFENRFRKEWNYDNESEFYKGYIICFQLSDNKIYE
jgi:hypothetical protein